MSVISTQTYLSVEQVSVRFNVSKDTIWRWRRESDFPKPILLGGRTSRWRLSDLEDYEAVCPCSFISNIPSPEAV